MAWYFVPDDWEPSEALLDWTRKKGVTDKTIEEELEKFRDHQYKRAMKRPDACWRNWVRNGIKWGDITPVVRSEYRRPEELSEDQRKKDIEKWKLEMQRLKVVK